MTDVRIPPGPPASRSLAARFRSIVPVLIMMFCLAPAPIRPQSAVAAQRTTPVADLFAQLERYDAATATHCRNVAVYAVFLAQRAGLGREQLANLRQHALLHDMGKLHTPLVVLNKPGKLDPGEFGTIKKHPADGARIILQAGLPAGSDVAAAGHHERWDGTGYPAGLKGEQIPLEARIVAVADVFSALTEDRPHRPRMAMKAVVKILREGAGSQFEPRLVDLFLSDEGELDRLKSDQTRGPALSR